jgi:hypothetical protein
MGNLSHTRHGRILYSNNYMIKELLIFVAIIVTYQTYLWYTGKGMTGGSCGMTGGSCAMTGGSCGMTGGSCAMTGGSCGMTGGSCGMTGGGRRGYGGYRRGCGYGQSGGVSHHSPYAGLITTGGRTMPPGFIHNYFTKRILEGFEDAEKPAEPATEKPVAPVAEKPAEPATEKPAEKTVATPTVVAPPVASPAVVVPHNAQSLYSDDLVSIETREGRKVALVGDSKYIIANDGSDMNNRLFKLRFKLVRGGDNALTAIKYRDPISLVYTDEAAKTVYINHDGHVNILTNRHDTIFQLIDNKNQASTDTVNITEGAEFLIKCGATGDLYLKVEPTQNSIKTAPLKDATVFVIRRQKGCGPLWRFRQDGDGTIETSKGWGIRRLMSRWW